MDEPEEGTELVVADAAPPPRARSYIKVGVIIIIACVISLLFGGGLTRT